MIWIAALVPTWWAKGMRFFDTSMANVVHKTVLDETGLARARDSSDERNSIRKGARNRKFKRESR